MHRLSQSDASPATDDDVLAYIAGFASDAPIRPAMVSNPMAARNWRTVAHQRLSEEMPDAAACVSTPSVADLPRALDWLLFKRRSNVLVVNGGDGTIHHGVNALLTCVDAAAERVGRPVPLPSVLFVNGGGMNMLARTFQTRGHPLRTLRRFRRLVDARRYGELTHREVPLMKIREPEGERYGFIFGSELVLNALTMYERFGRGYRGLARFLWAVGSGYTIQTELWQRFGHLLDAPTSPLLIDGVIYPRYTCVVCTTVPMLLAKGVVGTIRNKSHPGRFNLVAVLLTDKGEVIRAIPRLGLGMSGEGLRYENDVREVVVHGPYTIDGERITTPYISGDDAIRVMGCERIVRGVWLY